MMMTDTLTTNSQIFDENLLILKTTALNNFYHCNASVYKKHFMPAQAGI